MNTRMVTATRSATFPASFALLLGAVIIGVAGHVQAAALHGAAHDTRHANGFPCP